MTLAPAVQRGVCYAHSYASGGVRGYGSTASRRSRIELKQRGVAWLSLTPFGYSAGLGASEVRHIGSYPGGETDDRVRREIREAHGEGFQILLKPHVWIHGGGFRGEISPAGPGGWSRWFASYSTWLLRYARLAEAEQVAVLSVGVEFVSSSVSREQDWRSLVRAVRAVYRGKLVYAANWNEVARVKWWTEVDYIGVQFYPPLATGPETPEEERVRRLNSQLDRLAALSRRTGRPLLLTEVGYRSSPDTDERPYAWPGDEGVSEISDTGAQERSYRRLLRALRGRPEVHGVYPWKWFSDPASKEEGLAGFSLRGTPAAQALAESYRQGCGSSAPAGI